MTIAYSMAANLTTANMKAVRCYSASILGVKFGQLWQAGPTFAHSLGAAVAITLAIKCNEHA